MGWTGDYRWVGKTAKEIITDDLSDNSEILRIEGSGVCSLAIKNKKTGEVWGLVALIKRYPNEVVLKLIDETCGPCEAKASAKLIGMLSPTEHEYALGWRERCLKQASKPKIKPNVLITLDKALPFSGGAYMFQYFMKVGRRMYACDENGDNAKRVKFNPEKYNWTQ